MIPKNHFETAPQRVKEPNYADASKAPSDEGKRSDVTGVNDSPVDCQSRDRNRRSDLSPQATEGEKMFGFSHNFRYFVNTLAYLSPSQLR